MNKKDIKKISREFRQSASRVLNAHYEDFPKSLRLFLLFIEKTPVIIDYIHSLPPTGLNAEQEMQEVIDNHGRAIFSLGDTTQEETVNIFMLLKIMPEDLRIIISICAAYQHGKYQESIKAFGNRVILPFVNHVECYLNDIGIDMGIDENTQYNITVNGGQFNLSQDSSIINATQNNGIDLGKLSLLIKSVKDNLSDNLPAEQSEAIRESLEMIQDQLKAPIPKKSFVRAAIGSLKNITTLVSTTTELGKTLNELIAFVTMAIS